MCGDKGPAFCTGVFTPLAVGIPMIIWGRAVHSGAVNASRTSPYGKRGAETGSGVRVFVAPVVGTEKGEPSGAAIVGTF
jgi:hypothetical protein